jgi:hypothetical protein
MLCNFRWRLPCLVAIFSSTSVRDSVFVDIVYIIVVFVYTWLCFSML